MLGFLLLGAFLPGAGPEQAFASGAQEDREAEEGEREAYEAQEANEEQDAGQAALEQAGEGQDAGDGAKAADSDASQDRPVLKGYENTVWGVTGPDGQVISGYTWEMNAAAARERGKNGIRLKIKGNLVDFPDQQPVLEQGRVLVPMRPVFESVYVQCRVNWDSEANKATVLDQRGRQVVFVPGETSYTVIKSDGSQRIYPLDVPAKILEGRVMLPLRALLETFEFRVEWVEIEKLILVTDNLPSWRKLMKPEEWQKALEEDCVPCAQIKEAP
ncbi:MAG: copper amine oxidase N-terminal domain-containing protein [Clostridiales bacterium]|nr:copper amine oxidase N-terminal domain-containing protein [Clostridiales bacterium]